MTLQYSDRVVQSGLHYHQPSFIKLCRWYKVHLCMNHILNKNLVSMNVEEKCFFPERTCLFLSTGWWHQLFWKNKSKQVIRSFIWDAFYLPGYGELWSCLLWKMDTSAPNASPYATDDEMSVMKGSFEPVRGSEAEKELCVIVWSVWVSYCCVQNWMFLYVPKAPNATVMWWQPSVSTRQNSAT